MKIHSRRQDMKADHNSPLCSGTCSCRFLGRWSQNIGHDSNHTSAPHSNSPGMTNARTGPYQASNNISSLIGSSNNSDQALETRAILAFVLLKELGSDFDGSDRDRLLVLSNNAPECVNKISEALQSLPLDTRKGIKMLTETVSLDPRSYKHNISRVYKDFVTRSPSYQPGKPSFGMLICMIVYLVELCRRFMDHQRANEIPSIHEHASLLMLDPETPLSPTNWTEYLDDQSTKERPPLERRPSLTATAASMIFSVVEAYARYTR